MFIKILIILWFSGIAIPAITQPVVSTHATKEKRDKFIAYLNKTIDQGLETELNDSNEEAWISSFYPLQLLQKQNDWIDGRIALAVSQITRRTVEFQTALLELLFANYSGKFLPQMKKYVQLTKDPVCFAMASEYILRSENNPNNRRWLFSIHKNLRRSDLKNTFINESGYHLHAKNTFFLQNLSPFFGKDYLPGNVLILSFQRKNRDHAGIAVVRDTLGNFLADSAGNIFYVQQLARSISGLPYYIRNGNTPQGVFRMDGFDVSKSSSIGPTQNIQLSMPFEISAAHFLKDSSYTEKELPLEAYRQLLPSVLAQHVPLYQSYYAGKIGRNEIIAHGTTIDPEWYSKKPWYPFTPGLGCLSTREIWDENTGTAIYSGQQMLVNAVKKAGGADGYLIVIDIDDAPRPVTMDDVLNRLNN